jgi:hypothetical protein
MILTVNDSPSYGSNHHCWKPHSSGWLAGLLACLKWKVMLEVFFTWQGIMYYELISEDATGKVFAYGRQFA